MTLRLTYESMTAEEAWNNKREGNSNFGSNYGDGSYSPLMRMNGTIYDKYIADPYFGSPPQDVHMLTSTKKAPFVLAFVREPSHDTPIEKHYRDTLLIKTLHALASDYEGHVRFGFVDIVKDEDNIAFSLGVDTLNPAYFPCIMLVHGGSMYVGPSRMVETYNWIAYFIEKGYKEARSVWPVQRRLGTFTYPLKMIYR